MPVTSNDPFSEIKTERSTDKALPEEVRLFHEKSDRDASILAVHHTLGPKRNQASPGDHIHDGKASRVIAEGKNETLTGVKTGVITAAQVNTALNNLVIILQKYIDITDART